jgi:hypothetical protein
VSRRSPARVNHGKIVEIESMVTQEGDWLFNANNFKQFSYLTASAFWGAVDRFRAIGRSAAFVS